MTSGYVQDTSVFIAAEQERPLDDPPSGPAHVSVATITELSIGVHRAEPGTQRTVREATLRRVGSFIALPYDEDVALKLGELLAAVRTRRRSAGAMDAIVAATALTHDLSIWTQDDDFDVLADLAPELRVNR